MVRSALMVLATVRRIKDEEVMMRREFGEEWERWHARTKRLVPGVL